MAGDTKIYEDRELEIYRQYQNVIAPFIVDLEVRDGEYPIEIFNEIRATFTHISRYKVQNSTDDLISAERHIKRATLDCYKYLCVSHAEEIKAFRYNYRSVDLHLADNGNQHCCRIDWLGALTVQAIKRLTQPDISGCRESLNAVKHRERPVLAGRSCAASNQ